MTETPACRVLIDLCGTCGHHDYDHHASGAFDSTPFCKSCVYPGQHPFTPATCGEQLYDFILDVLPPRRVRRCPAGHEQEVTA